MISSWDVPPAGVVLHCLEPILNMTQHDSTWLNMTQHDSTWLNMTQHGSNWLKMAQHDSTWLNMAQHDWTWLNMTQHGSKWLKMAQHDSTWLNMAQHDIQASFVTTAPSAPRLAGVRLCSTCARVTWVMTRLGQTRVSTPGTTIMTTRTRRYTSEYHTDYHKVSLELHN